MNKKTLIPMTDYIEEIKSPCCNSDWYRKSRANFRCKKCDKDITFHVFYIIQAEEEFKENNDKR